jgi:hypothetical protein
LTNRPAINIIYSSFARESNITLYEGVRMDIPCSFKKDLFRIVTGIGGIGDSALKYNSLHSRNRLGSCCQRKFVAVRSSTINSNQPKQQPLFDGHYPKTSLSGD